MAELRDVRRGCEERVDARFKWVIDDSIEFRSIDDVATKRPGKTYLLSSASFHLQTGGYRPEKTRTRGMKQPGTPSKTSKKEQ